MAKALNSCSILYPVFCPIVKLLAGSSAVLLLGQTARLDATGSVPHRKSFESESYITGTQRGYRVIH